MNIKFALKTAAIAAALVCSGTSHAADAYTRNFNDGGQITDAGAHLFQNDDTAQEQNQGIAVYDMTRGDTNYLAFCIQPNVDLTGGQYYATYNYNLAAAYGTTRADNIKALYETAYSSLDSTESKMAFQLALWELKEDDGNICAHSGTQYFSAGGAYDDITSGAQSMINTANTYLTNHGTLSTYTYTVFGPAAGEPASQLLLGAAVAAVPEADTWAMMGLGLGLLGFVARRKSKGAQAAA